MEERRLRLFENGVLRRIIGPKREKVTEYGADYIMRSYMTYIPHQILFTFQIKKNEMGGAYSTYKI
jgi:hypothetical protein